MTLFLRVPLILLLAISSTLFVSCGKNDAPTAETKQLPQPKELAEYTALFKDTFKNYQTSTTEVPKSGAFDFEFTMNADGDTKRLASFAAHQFKDPFSLLSIRLYGDYDFANLDTPSFSPIIKMYLNKGNTGEGDVDVSLGINGSGSLTYEVRNLNRQILDFFGIDSESARILIEEFEKNKGKTRTTELGTNLLKEVLTSLRESSENSPLYKNSKEEEQKIIDAFAESETIRVLSGAWIDDRTERVSFDFSAENFTKFLGEVGKILGNGNENKDFSGDAKSLAETIRIEGTLDIRDKRIVDSDIRLVLRLGGVDEKTGEKKADDLVFKIRFALPNPSRLDFDLDTQIFANSSPENVLRARFK